MHELSIATSIVKTAETEVKKINGESVSAIYLEIGQLSGVEVSALEFVWKPCVERSVLQNAQLFIDQPKGQAQCAECNSKFPIEHYFDSCPACGSPFKKIISGRELKIKKLIIH